MLARRIRTRSANGDVADDYVKTTVTKSSKQRVAADRTMVALRRKRDLIWIMCEDAGLTQEDMERVGPLMARDQAVISRRIAMARTHRESTRDVV